MVRSASNAANASIGSPAMNPTGAGPRSLVLPLRTEHTAMGTVAAALIAPWKIAGIQMLPLRSYSQSLRIPSESGLQLRIQETAPTDLFAECKD